MNTRQEIHDRFVAMFHLGNPPLPFTEQQLDRIELELETKLPAAYRRFMICYGVIHTPSILRVICDKCLDHADVQDFLGPQDAIDNTKGYWSAGMPSDIVGFASDCMGNMIGFRRQVEFSQDAPVLFFDHDFVDVNELAPSFYEFLLWYFENLKGEAND
jgi:hypothetical protein